MSILWKAKLKAFSVHILFSVLIISIFMGFVTQIWFPGILFGLEDVWEGLRILVPVDAILGPILTLILFVPGKKGLIGDLVIIASLQIAALVYGAYTIYDQRPEAIVFAGDRFEVLPASKFDKSKLDTNIFAVTDLPYPLITYALPAQTLEEQKEFIFNNVQYQKMPERFRPASGFKQTMLSRSLDISNFVPGSARVENELSKLKASFNAETQALFILEGTTGESVVMVLNKDDLTIAGYADIDPWEEYQRPAIAAD